MKKISNYIFSSSNSACFLAKNLHLKNFVLHSSFYEANGTRLDVHSKSVAVPTGAGAVVCSCRRDMCCSGAV